MRSELHPRISTAACCRGHYVVSPDSLSLGVEQGERMFIIEMQALKFLLTIKWYPATRDTCETRPRWVQFGAWKVRKLLILHGQIPAQVPI